MAHDINISWNIVLKGSSEPMNNKTRLKEFIKTAESIFDVKFFKRNFFLRKINIDWCKCSLSGFRADLFLFNFLKIEKRFSKHGYQSNKIIKYGDIFLRFVLKISIKINPVKKLKK